MYDLLTTAQGKDETKWEYWFNPREIILRLKKIQGEVTKVFDYYLTTKEMSPRKEVSEGFPNEGHIIIQLPAIEVSWFFDPRKRDQINWEDVFGTMSCLEKKLDQFPVTKIPIEGV